MSYKTKPLRGRDDDINDNACDADNDDKKEVGDYED